MSSENIVAISSSNFEGEVLGSQVPVLVDFWAPWCGPCKMVAPVLDELSDEYVGKAKICKVDVDENNALSAKFNVKSIPTLILFKDGSAIKQIVGAKSKKDLQNLIDSAL